MLSHNVVRVSFCLLIVGVGVLQAAADEPRPNVLFIAVDDLRPELGCYGAPVVKTPHIDRLARSGTVFTRAYCQQAICGQSRASLLTGLRPDTLHGSGMGVHFRKFVPDVITLPQNFKRQGYYALAMGKIYHGAFRTAYVGDRMDDPPSWSIPTWKAGPQYYFSPEGIELARRLFPAQIKNPDADPDDWVNHFVRGPATEAPQVADNLPYDGQLADHAVATLGGLGEKPFFLAVGFLKPHLPFIAPKKYWDLYDPADIAPVANPQPPEDVPEVAMHNFGELRYYYDAPKSGPVEQPAARRLKHGYLACVSYIDAQIGRILDELDRLDLRRNTIVVLWGDHGWSLGEHGLWCKHSNFEDATRVPLIISVPGATAAGRKCDRLVELVDLYPTLCGLAELEVPAGLEGLDMSPLLEAPTQTWKTAAFSQYPRGGVMGYSMRTDRYRFTEWIQRKPPGATVAMELYDHDADRGENINLAGREEHANLIKQLQSQLEAGWAAARP